MPRDRQIEFPPQQTHSPLTTAALLVVSIACAVVVILLLVTGVEGPFIGPWT